MMKYKQQFGIKLKITLAFSFVFIVLSLFFNVYSYRQIRSLLIEDNDRYLLVKASTLLDKTEISPAIIPLPDKNTAIRVFYHSGNKEIIVFESPGIIKNVRAPSKTGVSDTLGMRIAYVVSSNEDNPAELMLAGSAQQLNNNLNFLLMLLFICSIISVVIAALIAYILAQYLLQPVQQIINSARIINTNKLRDIIPVNNTADELQELTETINSMLLRIDESLQQQQNFFASASHELKTPLAILRTELEVNLKKPGLSNEINQLLNSQLSEINRLQQVVQEFLIVSQLKSGGLRLYLEPVDIAAMILIIFNRFSSLIIKKGLTTSIDFDQETENFIIKADQEKLRIVLMNVIENAIKYSVANNVVKCTVKKPTDEPLIKIAITNCITSEKVNTENLHNAFYRSDLKQNGAGLGLWLCSEIITMHGGGVTFLSEDFFFNVIIKLPLNLN